MSYFRNLLAGVCLLACAASSPAVPPRHMPVRPLPGRPQPPPTVAPFNHHVSSPFFTPTNGFSNPFSPFFQIAAEQRFMSNFQFNAALFNTRFGFPFAFQNQLFQQRLFLLQQQQSISVAVNPFLTSSMLTNFPFNPFLGTNQFGAFSPFLNTSFSPFVPSSFNGPPFMFPSAGFSPGGGF